ncbi:hypothetical protein C8Q72DRAFT_891655 [Fomitopsis betulina]|nr:hypothetical protein C8Q72DRAFT_891655 [Fomitopsis betulina]
MCKGSDEVAPGTTCPISFDPVEARVNDIDFKGWAHEQAVQLLQDKIGLGPDGWVKENELEGVKMPNREALEQTMAELEHEEDRAYIQRWWLFKDGARYWTAESYR